MCTDQNSKAGKDLITMELKSITSCLDIESSVSILCSSLFSLKELSFLQSHLKRALLEVISSNVVRSQDDIDQFVKCTLLNAQSEIEDQHKSIKESLDFLKEYEFIRQQVKETTEIPYTTMRGHLK